MITQGTLTNARYQLDEAHARVERWRAELHTLELVLTVDALEAPITDVSCTLAEIVSLKVIVKRCCVGVCLGPLPTLPSRSTHATTGYLRFGPMAQCAVHALKGLARCASPSRAR